VKTLSALCIFSLGANAALVLFLRSMPAPPTGPAIDIVSPHEAAAASRPAARSRSSGGSASVSTAQREITGNGNTWNELHSDNPGVLVTRLRAAGFPPRVLQAIVSSLVNEKFLARREAIIGEMAEAPFWKPTPNAFSDPEKMAALNKLNRERNEQLRKLLGADDPIADELQEVYLRRQFGDLPPEKMERLQDVITDYRELRTRLQPANRPATADDREKLAGLDREMRADLAKVLTPQELEQYDLRSSPTASQLRHRLDAFKPSEDEYRAIFQLSRTIEERFPLAAGVMDPQQQAARRAAEEQLKPQLQALLGAERYADYQQATNPSHATLNQVVSRFDLPLSSAREAVAMQKDIMGRAQVVLTSDLLSPAEQATQLQALSREAATKLGAALTPRGLEAYKQHGGAWLSRLSASQSGAAP
jgi:hypothetical protein